MTVKTIIQLMGFLNATTCAVLESLMYSMFSQSLFILQLITFDKYIKIKNPIALHSLGHRAPCETSPHCMHFASDPTDDSWIVTT